MNAIDRRFVRSPSNVCLFVCFCPLSPFQTLDGLFTRWRREINPTHLGSVPSGVSGLILTASQKQNRRSTLVGTAATATDVKHLDFTSWNNLNETTKIPPSKTTVCFYPHCQISPFCPDPLHPIQNHQKPFKVATIWSSPSQLERTCYQIKWVVRFVQRC